MEQQTSFKGGGDGRDGNGANIFASIFNFWNHNHVSTFSIYLPVHSYSWVRLFCCFIGSCSKCTVASWHHH